MESVNQIMDAFTKAESRDRIELMVGMCKLLTPTELRFTLTSLEDLAANNLRLYQKIESEANDCKRLSSIPRPEASLDEIVGQAVLFTSFLRRDNINGARVIARILDEVMQRVDQRILSTSLDDELQSKEASKPPRHLDTSRLAGDVLLLFSLASHHAAFSFSSRIRLHDHLRRLHSIFDRRFGQSLGGSSLFSSQDSAESSSECGALPSTTSEPNRAFSETTEKEVTPKEQSGDGSIPFHVAVSPRNLSVASSEPQPAAVLEDAVQELKSLPSNGQSEVCHGSLKESPDLLLGPEKRSSCKANVRFERRSSCSSNGATVEHSTENYKTEEPSHPNQSSIKSESSVIINQNHVGSSVVAMTTDRPDELWPSVPQRPPSILSSNPHSPIEPATPSSSKCQVSTKSLLEKLISSNVVTAPVVESAKEKRRSLGGNLPPKPRPLDGRASPLVDFSSNASIYLIDKAASVAAPTIDFDAAVDQNSGDDEESCDISCVEEELSRSFLPDLLEFKDESSSDRLASDRRASMPPYLPSSLLPMFKGEIVNGSTKEKKNSRETRDELNVAMIDRNSVNDAAPKNGDSSPSNGQTRMTINPGSPSDAVSIHSNSPATPASIVNGSHRNGYHVNKTSGGQLRTHSRNGNGSTVGYRNLLDHQKHRMAGGHCDNNGQGTRNYYFRNGRGNHGDSGHRSTKQNYYNNMWNGVVPTHFYQNRMQRLNNNNIFQLQAHSKATFQQQPSQQYQQTTFRNNNNNQSQHQQMHNQSQQQSQNSSGSPPGAFTLQHLNNASSATASVQGFYAQYLAPYPAEFAQAIVNPAYYGIRNGLVHQTAVINNVNGAVYPQNGNGSLRFHPNVPRGVASPFYPQGTQMVVAAFRPSNDIQPLLCQDLVAAQSPQTLFFDPTVPPPHLLGSSTSAYPSQVVVYDAKRPPGDAGKLTCSNCAGTDHNFTGCPHSLPALPR